MVQAATRGDSAALAALWDDNRRWVAAVLLAHMPRGAELEDLLQEVATVLVSRISEVRDSAALRGWLRTVALNTARTAGRRKSVARRGLLERWRLSAATHSENHATPTPESAELNEEGRRVLEAATRLPEAYREPLLLRCVRGMSYRQIADVMDLPETTIENRIVRGRRMVRELLERPVAPGDVDHIAGSNGTLNGAATAPGRRRRPSPELLNGHAAVPAGAGGVTGVQPK
ncbi:MAG: sigma-70 family RNA polymerase sigma factor [Phycisphaerales bacterium]|nr:sigma-70 family RNA polymerase sigma factor [Phycisphaerales bacterium]